ncbi:MAG TPA: class I SAM-dependent methyltransferase [Methylomirabilota bacterium]|nr:class I SAM-dependent methyltransferase [Methylomirabilota bacterium]
MGEWFTDGSLWADLYPFTFTDERLRLGAQEVARVLDLVGLRAPEGKPALDLCCGPGRHAVPLAQRGMRVTGVDRTRFMLDKARERARLAAVDVELVEADMRDFRRPAAYDLVISLFTSFGYFDSSEDDLKVLGNVRASLKPHGAFVIDVMGKEWLARHFQPTRSRSLPDGTLLLDRNEVVDDWTRVHSEGILIRDGQVRTFRQRLSVYSGLELKDRLRQASFATVALYGGLDGAPYGLDAARLVAVARAGA